MATREPKTTFKVEFIENLEHDHCDNCPIEPKGFYRLRTSGDEDLLLCRRCILALKRALVNVR